MLALQVTRVGSMPAVEVLRRGASTGLRALVVAARGTATSTLSARSWLPATFDTRRGGADAGRQRGLASAAAAAAAPTGAQWGMRPEDADMSHFFARLHGRIQARDPPRRADVLRFVMRSESKAEAEQAVALVKAYRPWMPKLDPAAGGLLLRACIRAGELDFAVEVLHAHRQLRASLSKAVCLDLLAALSKAGKTDEMLAAFAYMRTAHPGIVSSKALGILVAGLGNAGQAAQSVDLLLQTRAAGVRPKPHAYRILLKSITTQMENPDTHDAAEQLRAKVAKVMLEDNIADAECDALLAFSPPAAAAPAKEGAAEDAPAEEAEAK